MNLNVIDGIIDHVRWMDLVSRRAWLYWEEVKDRWSVGGQI